MAVRGLLAQHQPTYVVRRQTKRVVSRVNVFERRRGVTREKPREGMPGEVIERRREQCRGVHFPCERDYASGMRVEARRRFYRRLWQYYVFD